MAWYTAYNIDGTAYHKGLPRNDNWMPDPSWPESLQPHNNHFRGSGWDRGHLVSPGTVCWGDVRIAGIARRQANYFTNSTPQSSKMNTRWWLLLEQLERKMAIHRKRAIGMSGPVFGEDDETFRDSFEKDEMFIAKETYRIPKSYWKLIVVKNGNNIEYGAFVLDQFLLEEETKKTPFLLTDFTVSLKTLEDTTGLVFCKAMHQLKMINKKTIMQFTAP
jgi:endonuclease G